MGLLENLKLAKAGFKPDEIKGFNASGIETSDIIELSKNGYSAADINSLIDISKDEGGILQSGNDEKITSSGDSHGNDDEQKDNSDDKKIIDEKNAEIEKLKSMIEMQQKKNAAKNMGGGVEKNPHDIIKEAFKNLY